MYKKRFENTGAMSSLPRARFYSFTLLCALFFALFGGCSSNGDDFVSLKAKGLEHIGAGDYEKAEERLQLALKKQPSDRETLFFLGVAQNNLGKDSLAISNFRKVIKLYGPDGETARNLILASLAGEDWDSGLEGLYALVESGEPMSNLYLEFYDMYFRSGRLLNASRMMDSLIKQEPERADYYLKAANLKGKIEMYDEAEMQLQEALRRFGPTVEIYSNLGVLQMHQENFGRAEQLFRKGVELAPTNDGALMNLANCLSLSNDPAKQQEAVATYRRMSQERFDAMRLDTIVSRLEFELGR